MIFSDVDFSELFDIPRTDAVIGYTNFDNIVLFRFLGFPINSTIFSTWIVILTILLLSVWATHGLKKGKPTNKIQTILEEIVLWLRAEIKETANDNPMKYIGLGLGLFMFILISNLMTIIPWFRPPTASLTTTIAMATLVFLAVPYFSIKNAGVLGYLKKFIDPSPVMLPMNIFSEIFSIFALGLRLFGNMLSGVMFATILTSFLPFLIPLSMQTLGLLTGSIQAYIFALLAIVYTSSVGPTTPYTEENGPNFNS